MKKSYLMLANYLVRNICNRLFQLEKNHLYVELQKRNEILIHKLISLEL